MQHTVSIDELRKVPFIDVANLHGRVISTLSFYVDDEWQLWITVAGGQLINIKGEPGEGFYFSKDRARSDDLFLGFLDFIAQQACWAEALKALEGIKNDFFNICASLAKLDILFEYSKSSARNSSCSRLVLTELEYLFGLCRSIYDLLQEIISTQWARVKLLDGAPKKTQLPSTFSRVVLDGERIRSAEELTAKYHIPKDIADFYVRSAPFFLTLRKYRDMYIHGGSTIDLIFVTERGFAVQSSLEPFASFNVWSEEHMLPNKLCSLRPAVGYIVNQTLLTCEDYASTISKIIKYPPPIVPEFRYFMRGYSTGALQSYVRGLQGCLWWDNA